MKLAGFLRSETAVAILIGLLPGLSLTACIRSRVTITSSPPAAEVTWQGKPRGVTPITIPFKWYWYYDYSLEKEGYEKIEVVERLRTPPWFLLPLDFLAEILPIPLPDHRERHYVLVRTEETTPRDTRPLPQAPRPSGP